MFEHETRLRRAVSQCSASSVQRLPLASLGGSSHLVPYRQHCISTTARIALVVQTTVQDHLALARQHVRLLTERTVEQFLLRVFLRDLEIRSMLLVAPYISTLEGTRFTLRDLSDKIQSERIPTYIVTRPPSEQYQTDAMAALAGNEWIEIRYNEAVHAKAYVTLSVPESESFALFGSGNLTGKAVEVNFEVGMMILARGVGRPLVGELAYWINNRLRVLDGSVIHQRIRGRRRHS